MCNLCKILVQTCFLIFREEIITFLIWLHYSDTCTIQKALLGRNSIKAKLPSASLTNLCAGCDQPTPPGLVFLSYSLETKMRKTHPCRRTLTSCNTLLEASLVAQTWKNPPAMQETWVPSLGREDPLEKGMATHSSILAWRIRWTEEPGGLQSVESEESDMSQRLTPHFVH